MIVKNFTAKLRSVFSSELRELSAKHTYKYNTKNHVENLKIKLITIYSLTYIL